MTASETDPRDTPDGLGLARQLHPRALAYLGDAVYELHIRQAILASGPMRPEQLHRETTSRVKAAYQADLLAGLTDWLTPEEADLVRRARNVAVAVSRRADHQVHRQATAFEALVGWLHLTDPARLEALWGQLP